jgi:hypothetical protein
MRRTLALVVLALALWPAAACAAQPTTPPLAYYGTGFRGFDLSRLDPLTLAPLDPRANVGEWHSAYSLAPDGRQLVSSISSNGLPTTPGQGRVGLRTYDLTTFEVVREFRIGVAASAVGWLAPRRIVAKTQGGQIVLADPVTGEFRVTGRSAGPGCIDPPGKAVTRNRLVYLLGSTLNSVDRDGERRSRLMRGMSDDCGRLGFAMDRGRELAYVVGVGAEVAQVNVRTMRVTYHRVGSTRATAVAGTRAQGFGAFQIAAAHHNSRGMPKGVELIDLREDERRRIDPGAGGAVVAGERLLTYDGRAPVSPGGSKGIRGYDLSGRRRFTLLPGEVVHRLDVLGRFAYAQTRAGLRVIDLRRREVVSRTDGFDPDTFIHFVLPDRAGM